MNAALRLVDSPAWSIAGWSLLHYLWIGAALGVAAWTLKRAVRPLCPQTRYAVALLLFAALAVAPPLVAWRVATHQASESVAARLPPPVLTEQPVPPDDAARAQLSSARALPASVLPPLQPTAPPVETIEAFLIRHSSSVLAVAVRWAPGVWILGMPLTFAFLATGLFGAERLRQRSSLLVDGPIADATRRWAEALRITRTVAVGVSDRVVAPLVIGVLRPMIVLPASIVARQSPEQMEMILLHELSHVRRADNLVNLIQRVVEAVLFFQPAVWFVSRWVRLEREHCCDNMVLSYTGDPQGYAETLASLAMPGISPAYAAAAMANHQLVSRIQHILSREEQTMSLSPKIAAVAGAICLVIGLSLSGAAQQTAPVENPPATKAAAAEDAAADSEKIASVDEFTTSAAKAYFGEVLDKGTTRLTEINVHENGDVGVNGDTSVAGTVAFDDVGFRQTHGEKRSWGPEQATGAPDVPNAGDDTRAWASLTQDDQDEWLELSYAEPVEVIAVQIFANYCPGAVSRVTVFDANTTGLQYTWQGEDPVKAGGPRARGVSIITIPASIKTDRVRIELASKSATGWNEIDAVGLLDANGKTHWATEAAASSTYAGRAMVTASGADSATQRLFYRQAVAQAQLAQEQAASAHLLEYSAKLMRKRSADGRDWSPDQATGAPADLSAAEANGRRHAWRPAQPDAGRETLNAFYDEPVKAKLLLVYELGEPGTVDVVCRDAQGMELRVLSGRDVKKAGASSVLSLPLDGKLAINSIVLGLDTAANEGWSDIDAVGLIDENGKVHWADRAQATSTHADIADQATKASYRGWKWLQDHGQHTSNASCASCHKDASATESGGDRALLRVPVSELLEKSDSDLRDWLKKHGAAKIHIDETGSATVEGTAAQSFLNSIQTRPKEPANAKKNRKSKTGDAKPGAPPANRGSQADPRGAGGSDPNVAAGDVVFADISESVASAALDVMDPKGVDWAKAAEAKDAAKRIDSYQRAYDAQLSAAVRQSGDPKVTNSDLAGRQRLSDWIAVTNIIEGADQVQIALAAGERGYFSRPNRKIVRAERVEVPDAKNVLAITITSDGLEFVGSEPGLGRLRCWDQNGGTIEISVTVEAKALPEGDPRGKPGATFEKPSSQKETPDPRDASKSEMSTAIDRLVSDYVNQGVLVGNPAAPGQEIARRAYLDLLGVVPTTEQIKQFVGDGSEDALTRSLRKLADEATFVGEEEQ